MLTFSGILKKMPTDLQDKVQYYLPLNQTLLHMNQLIGKTLTFIHTGYHCLHCDLEKKIFRQGFCYDCFMQSPAVGDWIMHPQLSTAHLDIEDRDLEYEKKVQLQPHIVYFAFANGLKVGVTRKTQVPTRWIDQGANMAVAIAEVPNRYLAGIAEVALKNKYADKTNWRKMLSSCNFQFDFKPDLDKIIDALPEEVQKFASQSTHEVINIHYPILHYPLKINSISLEKTSHFSGKLSGIKGQYLLFESGDVMNIRAHEGYKIDLQLT